MPYHCTLFRLHKVLKSDYRAPEVSYPINWTKGIWTEIHPRLTGKNLTILISKLASSGDDK